MKTKTINLYKFTELTAEQQAKVLDKYRDFNDDIFASYVEDEFCTLELLENGFLNPQVHYSLGYCQGDGACFDCTEFDFDLLLKDWNHKHKQWIIDIIKEYCSAEISPNLFARHYSHSNTRHFEINTYRVEDNYKDRTRLVKAIQDADNYIENLRYELAENLTNRLYEQLEWSQSDEQIAESLIANEYYFNGETLEIEY